MRSLLLFAAFALLTAQSAFSEQRDAGLPEEVRQMIAIDDVAALRLWVGDHPEDARRLLNARSGLIDTASQGTSRDVMLYLVMHADKVNPVWHSLAPQRMKSTEALAASFLGTWTEYQRGVLDETLRQAAEELAYEIRYPLDKESIDERRELVALLLRHGGDYTIEVAAYLGDAHRVRFLDSRLTRQPTDSKSFKFDSDGPYDPALDAFQIAVQFCHAEIVEYFLAQGFDPNQWVGDGLYYPAITYACEYGSDRCLRALLEAGADPNVVVFENCQVGRSGPPYPYDGCRPLDIVLLSSESKEDAIERARLLVENGASTQADPKSCSNPLANAIVVTNVEAVRYLLEEGADATTASAYRLAGLAGEQKYVSQYCGYGYHRSDSTTGFCYVAVDTINGRDVELVDRDVDGDGKSDGMSSPDLGFRFTPLQVAADRLGTGNGHDYLSVWIGGTANANQRTSKLATAAKAGQIVSLLREFGVDDDLYSVVSLDEPDRIRRLLSKNAELEFPNWRDALLNRAIQLGNTAALATLLQSGFDANSVGPDKAAYEKQGDQYRRVGYEDGDSLLTRVVRTGHIDLLEVVLGQGADIRGAGTRELESAGHGPLAEAIFLEDTDVLEELLSNDVPDEELSRVIAFVDKVIQGQEETLQKLVDSGARTATKRAELALLLEMRSRLQSSLVNAKSGQ